MFDVEFTEERIAITDYKGYGGVLRIPSTLNGFPVVSIEAGALRSKGLTAVTIPSSITTIGNGASAGNKLTSIEILPAVVFVGSRAFAGNPLDKTVQQTIQEKYGEAALVYHVGDIWSAGVFLGS